ncbi:DnaJ domain-containing protein [Sphingomonas sp. LR59]|uniref:DnaJ domain-containing protein n=1 Tax=Sphingomonas sp. LR59 TaxID=3050232 RepID=UPI003FA6B37E
MAVSPDYYSVLGVPSTASRVTIHAAWKALLRQYHPDANHGVDVSARAKAINEAYPFWERRKHAPPMIGRRSGRLPTERPRTDRFTPGKPAGARCDLAPRCSPAVASQSR